MAFLFTGGYTYAHALDIASSNFGGGIPQNSNAPNLEYGDSNFDIRHRFTFTTTYAIPGREGFRPDAQRLADQFNPHRPDRASLGPQ